LIEEIEQKEPSDAILILSLRGVPLVDATGLEVLREIWHRQHKAGGDVLLAALQPRAENLLRRSGFLDEVGNERIFWSADRAILSLGGDLPAAPKDAPEEDNLDSTLVVTPHEERSAKKF
jgi:MFS superfamily sulfate permease-like transporter